MPNTDELHWLKIMAKDTPQQECLALYLFIIIIICNFIYLFIFEEEEAPVLAYMVPSKMRWQRYDQGN